MGLNEEGIYWICANNEQYSFSHLNPHQISVIDRLSGMYTEEGADYLNLLGAAIWAASEALDAIDLSEFELPSTTDMMEEAYRSLNKGARFMHETAEMYLLDHASEEELPKARRDLNTFYVNLINNLDDDVYRIVLSDE